MLSQLSRVTRATSAVRAVTRVARGNTVQVRGFIAPTVSRKACTANIPVLLASPTADFVQDLYLKELKAYKTPAVKESDAEGQVQAFTMPKTPASPEEADLASNLKDYESMAVEIEGQDAAQAGQGDAAALPDWLEAEEDDEPAH
ncbi:ATP synthase H chain [Metarhizium album ARSEF 1941]|uniref:ATP synthase H chain n=1 Tax=Metarhizium album (strain ARSEF 1941) TaxID=1081103 RepID=A0A0B2X427_METAS|nr:ATP synthase H chain [Metarhizium album ARSEF 1941]KHO00066.1 ATP synthase H chain [Metarhizium album ARSEF 1941]